MILPHLKRSSTCSECHLCYSQRPANAYPIVQSPPRDFEALLLTVQPNSPARDRRTRTASRGPRQPDNPGPTLEAHRGSAPAPARSAPLALVSEIDESF